MNTSRTDRTSGTATPSDNPSVSGPVAGSTPQSGSSGAGSTAGAVASEVSRTAQKTARVAKEHAADLASHLGRDISAMADDQKNRGLDVVRTFARALTSAASEIEEESPTVASLVRDAADQVEGFSDRLRERSARDLWSSATDVARSQPIVFFAGAVVAGFALSRFLKSSAEHRSYRGASTYPDTYGQSPGMRSGAGAYGATSSPGMGSPGTSSPGTSGTGAPGSGYGTDRAPGPGTTGMGTRDAGSPVVGTSSPGAGPGSTGTSSTDKTTGSTGMSPGSSGKPREGRHGRT